jgi:hypothetical protein
MRSYFSETKTHQFIQYLNHLIQTTPGEDDLLKIVQSLSSTLKVLTKDKPKKIVDNIVRTFCNLFKKTVIDPTIVEFLLVDTILLEDQGKASVFAEVLSKKRDLYKQAQSLLLQNTKNAMGLIGDFITLPLDNKVVYGHNSLIEETIKINGSTYPNSSVKINHVIVPALPMMMEDSKSLINEQCIRQFIRTIISRQYGVDQMGDLVIYVVMGLVLQMTLSEVNKKYLAAYRQLGHIMLRKKRMNSDTTELQRLEDGELPIPNNGQMDAFYGYMNRVSQLLGLSCQPMTLWYAMCLAMKNPALVAKQLIHCASSISKDYPGIDHNDLLAEMKPKITPVTVHELPLIDYKCIITLEDCSKEGGYMFKPHQSPTDATCAPIYVVSNQGYSLLLNQPTVFCPICYQSLTKDDFKPVTAKVGHGLIFQETVTSPFGAIRDDSGSNYPSSYKKPQTQPQAPTVSATSGALTKTGLLVLMKGTVGAGKSTYALKLQQEIERIGGHCLNEGTDKYCRQGHTIQDACKMVTSQLKTIHDVENPLLVVIIDTCGDRNNGGNSIFDVDFSGWKKMTIMPNYDKSRQDQYLAWSLRNVLRRGLPDQNSNYCLNPVNTSVNLCVEVHGKKAKAIFGKKTRLPSSRTNMNDVLNDINQAADQYADFLEQSMNLDTEIAKIMKKIETYQSDRNSYLSQSNTSQ